MAVCLPRRAVENWISRRQQIYLLSPPGPEHASFLHIRADGGQREYYGPPVVAWGTSITGFRAGTLDPPAE
jgi:hypothetical protein